MSKQCSAFLGWVSDSSTGTLYEVLWKHEMQARASERFGALNQEEIEKIVERDWKYMGEEERNVSMLVCRK